MIEEVFCIQAWKTETTCWGRHQRPLLTWLLWYLGPVSLVYDWDDWTTWGPYRKNKWRECHVVLLSEWVWKHRGFKTDLFSEDCSRVEPSPGQKSDAEKSIWCASLASTPDMSVFHLVVVEIPEHWGCWPSWLRIKTSESLGGAWALWMAGLASRSLGICAPHTPIA